MPVIQKIEAAIEPWLSAMSEASLPARILGIALSAVGLWAVFMLAIKGGLGRVNLKHVPGPFLSRLSGLEMTVAGIRGTKAQKLSALHAKYGPIVRVGPSAVSVASWQNYRPLYGSSSPHPKEPVFYGAATFVPRPNIFQMTNPQQHSARRRLSAAVYSLKSIARLDPLISDAAARLVHRLRSGAVVDVYEPCGLYSLEVICAAGFAKRFDDNDDSESRALLHAMEGSAGTLILNAVLPFLESLPLAFRLRLPGFAGACYRQHHFWMLRARDMVDHFLAHTTDAEERFLLTPLAAGTDSFLGRKLTHEELVEEAMTYMFAGSGTTSSTLLYLLYAIARSEGAAIQRRLRAEIAALPEGDMTALRGNAYVTAVIKETFRLYPTIISTLPRVLAAPMRAEPLGTLLPAGTVVGMANYVHHRDPHVFAEPERFVPERWLGEKGIEAMEASLTPFSVGRRNCIGQNLAWEELYVAVDAIMRAGLSLRLGKDMESWEMEMEDRFNIAPRGRRLMLEVTQL